MKGVAEAWGLGFEFQLESGTEPQEMEEAAQADRLAHHPL